MPKIFEYTDYKAYMHDYLKKLPKGGRGYFTRFAEVAQTHKATISQVFSGDNHLTCEQAVRIGEFLKWGSKEIRYFVLLVNFAAAGSASLRAVYERQIEAERDANVELSNRLVTQHKLTGEQRAVFYSNWTYSAVRILSSIDHFQTPQKISDRLNVPLSFIETAVDFLVRAGLCELKDGKIRPGPKSTFLESKSPLVARHHGNWRIKAMERHPVLNRESELSYTAPVSLSAKDVKKIREILAQAIERVDDIVEPSDCEKFYCLNVDWFEVN